MSYDPTRFPPTSVLSAVLKSASCTMASTQEELRRSR